MMTNSEKGGVYGRVRCAIYRALTRPYTPPLLCIIFNIIDNLRRTSFKSMVINNK